MKTLNLFTLIAGILLSSAVCSIFAKSNSHIHNNHDMHGHHMSMEMNMDKSKNESTLGTGIINSIDINNNSINITHEPIPDIGWPEMTMDLSVSKRVDLSAFSPGDNVEFTLKLGRDKVYRIIKMDRLDSSRK